MTPKPLPRDPVKGALVYLLVLDTVGIGLGTLFLLFVEPWFIGLGVILVGSLAGGALFLFKLVNVSCPDCRGSLRRDPHKGYYVCARCGAEWGGNGK